MELPLKEKGRGARINPDNPYNEYTNIRRSGNNVIHQKTRYHPVYPKSIVNKVPSEDIGMEWSINPYQGCEHGCVYCYARNSHNYWGYSAGIDFESNILFKREASLLLRKTLEKKSWRASPIMISGNTDCYQPIERKLGITRSLLEVLWEFRHPAGIITKNQLIKRDLDILSDMAKERLVRVAVSINTLDESIRSSLEPRTATIKQRFAVVEEMAKNGIPVVVMIAPVIPGLTSQDIIPLAKQAADAGASGIRYIIVRLNGAVQEIFSHWLSDVYPERASGVINQIASCHGGQVNDSRIGKRMQGEGKIAEMIRDQFKLAERKYFEDRKLPNYNLSLYPVYKNRQLDLFQELL